MDNLLSNSHWLKGPEFLWHDDSDWPISPATTTDVSDLELKEETLSCLTVSQDSSDTVVQQFLVRYSLWYKLKKSVAWLLRVRTFLWNKVHRKQCHLLACHHCQSVKFSKLKEP